MNAIEVASWRGAVMGRWAARIVGTLMFLLFLAFFFGEGPPNLSRLTPAERVQALGVAALFLGLPIAWKWEGLGGLITVGSFASLCAISVTNLHMWVLYIPALAGAVHLASWARLRMAPPRTLVPWRLPGSVVISLFAALAVFILLCSNEIFGQPPLMTPTLHPHSSLAGNWHGLGSVPVDFLIHPDGSVTGAVGNAAITEGRITYGRSWFGKLLHINSWYRVTGKLSNEPFTAPLDYGSEALDGSLFLRNRPMHVRLTRRQP
jgi:hypothetical protein